MNVGCIITAWIKLPGGGPDIERVNFNVSHSYFALSWLQSLNSCGILTEDLFNPLSLGCWVDNGSACLNIIHKRSSFRMTNFICLNFVFKRWTRLIK